MNENVVQGELKINQNKGMNQDNPLNNQYYPWKIILKKLKI